MWQNRRGLQTAVSQLRQSENLLYGRHRNVICRLTEKGVCSLNHGPTSVFKVPSGTPENYWWKNELSGKYQFGYSCTVKKKMCGLLSTRGC